MYPPRDSSRSDWRSVSCEQDSSRRIAEATGRGGYRHFPEGGTTIVWEPRLLVEEPTGDPRTPPESAWRLRRCRPQVRLPVPRHSTGQGTNANRWTRTRRRGLYPRRPSRRVDGSQHASMGIWKAFEPIRGKLAANASAVGRRRGGHPGHRGGRGHAGAAQHRDAPA